MSTPPSGLRALVMTLGIAVTTPHPLPAQQPQRYTLTGERIAVYNLAGEVEIVAGTGPGVVVEVRPGGSDGSKLVVESGPARGRTALRVRYPTPEVVYPRLGRHSSTDLRVRDDGTFFDDYDEGRDRGTRVRISGSGGGSEAYADLRVQVPAGSHVTVFLAVGAARIADVHGTIGVDGASARVDARNVRGSLTVDLGSGSATVAGVEGDVVIDTGSGSVNVSAVRGRSLIIDTGSGSVTAADLTVSDRLNVDTGSGRVRLAGVRARAILIDTGSGSVDLELLDDVESLSIDTGSGGVTLTVPPNLGAAIEVETSSGGIDAEIPVDVTRWNRSHLVGRIGDGRGRIVIDTGSGSVRLRRGT